MLVFSCQGLYAQYVDTVKSYYNEKWEKVDGTKSQYSYYRIAKKTVEGEWLAKDYYAHSNTLQMQGLYIDDSLIIKDGKFYYYHENGMLEEECSYNKNKPVGLYRSYDFKGRLLDSSRYKANGMIFHKAYKWDRDGNLSMYGEFDMEGNGTGYQTAYWSDSTICAYGKYTNGHVLDSVWTFYHRNGRKSMTMVYDSGRVLKYECFDTLGEQMTNCDTTAVLPVAPYNINEFFGRNLRMPMAAKEAGVLGSFRVVVQFYIDVDGKIINPEIVVGSYDEFNEEALRVVKMMPRWKPCKRHNRNILSYYKLPVSFRLE